MVGYFYFATFYLKYQTVNKNIIHAVRNFANSQKCALQVNPLKLKWICLWLQCLLNVAVQCTLIWLNYIGQQADIDISVE
jgi:hypothetical protein